MGARNSTPTPSKLSKEFRTQKIIGHGAFGVILQSVHAFDNLPYGIKIIKFPGQNQSGNAEKILLEAKNYAMIPSHQNIVSYKHSWLDNIDKKEVARLNKLKEMFPKAKALEITPTDRILCIQMELCSHNLRTYLGSCSIEVDPFNNEPLNENLPAPSMRLNVPKHLKIFEQITLGLRHLHKYGLMHRDLKPENVFFCLQDRTVVKIGDFGISKIVEINPDPSFMTGIGTPHYMPDEQYTVKYGKEVDIYALGLILVELFVSQSNLSFPTLPALRGMMLRQEMPAEFSTKFPELAELARNLIHPTPEERPSYNVILKTIQNYGRKVFIPPVGTNTNHTKKCDKCYKAIRGIRHRCFTCADVDYCDTCWEENKAPSSHPFFDVICCHICKKDLNTGRVFDYYVHNKEDVVFENPSYCRECFKADLDLAKKQQEVDKVVVDEFGQELDRYSLNENYKTIAIRKSGNNNQTEYDRRVLDIVVDAEVSSGGNSNNAYSTNMTAVASTSKSFKTQ